MRQPREPAVIVFAISGRVDRADIPALCERLRGLLENNRSDVVVCDVGRLTRVDLTTVDLLARLEVTARRSRRRIRVRRASRELANLLALTGLSDVVALESVSALQAQGQAEEREEPGRVEEEADPSNPTV